MVGQGSDKFGRGGPRTAPAFWHGPGSVGPGRVRHGGAERCWLSESPLGDAMRVPAWPVTAGSGSRFYSRQIKSTPGRQGVAGRECLGKVGLVTAGNASPCV